MSRLDADAVLEAQRLHDLALAFPVAGYADVVGIALELLDQGVVAIVVAGQGRDDLKRLFDGLDLEGVDRGRGSIATADKVPARSDVLVLRQ